LTRLTQEQQNKCFDRLLKKYGAIVLETKVQKLPSTRKYYIRWPYDGWQKRASMDSIDLVHSSDPLAELVAGELRAELLEGLTARERWVAERSEEGYMPRDMAFMRGVKASNADRWIKFSVKQKFIGKMEERDEE
jgi:hypothetical protein